MMQPSHVTKRWVPKNVLEVQGYYQGATQLLLPKTKLAPKMPELSQRKALNALQFKTSTKNEHPLALGMAKDKKVEIQSNQIRPKIEP